MAEEAQGASAGKEPAAGTDQTLKVDGGVIGSQVAVGTKVIQIRADGLSTILFVDSTEAPVTRRTLSAVIPARRNLVALGRERELVRLADAVARREIVQVYGESGSGKTTLLLHAAGRGTLGADTVPRCEGAVLLSARGLPMEELLQEIFLATYEAERMRLPAQGERRRLLAALRILLVVDDLECSEQELNEVIDSLPHSTLVLACSRLTLAGRGCTVGLNGLPLASAQTLFRDALDRELTPEEAAQAKRVWQETGGLPSRLGLIAAFLQEAAEHGIPPEVPPAAGLGLLIPKLLKWLSDEAVELLRALLSAGSAQWGEDLAACLRPDGAQSIHALVRSRLLVRDGSRLRSADGVAEALDAPDRNMVAATAESVAAWLRAATPADVAAETEAVIALTASAIEARLHREAVRLARAAAPRLMLGLRWRAWGRVLELGLESARASKSRKDEAYFTHESAVHAYCVGDFVKAAALLSAAVGLGVRGAEALQEALGHVHPADGVSGAGHGGGGDGGITATTPHASGTPAPSGRGPATLLKGKVLLATAAVVAGGAFTVTAVNHDWGSPSSSSSRPAIWPSNSGSGEDDGRRSPEPGSSAGQGTEPSGPHKDPLSPQGPGSSPATDPWAGFPFGERKVSQGDVRAGGFHYVIDTVSVIHGQDGQPELVIPAFVSDEIAYESGSRRLDRTPVLHQGGRTTVSTTSANTVGSAGSRIEFDVRLGEGFRWEDAVLGFPAYTEEETTLPLGGSGALVPHPRCQVVAKGKLSNYLMDVNVTGGDCHTDTSLWPPGGFPEKLRSGRASVLVTYSVDVHHFGLGGTDLYAENFTLVQPDGNKVRFGNAYATSFLVRNEAEAKNIPQQYIVTQVTPQSGTYTLLLDDYRILENGTTEPIHAELPFRIDFGS